MQGMHVETGQPVAGIDHLKQSIQDILTTPIGSRVMRRDYGSNLFSLIDKPVNNELLIDIYAAVAEALKRWEPRLIVESVKVNSIEQGAVTLSLDGKYKVSGKHVVLSEIKI